MLPSNLSFLKTENVLPGQNEDNTTMKSKPDTKKEGNVFKCEICNKCLTRKSNVKNHISKVHDVKNGFKCDLCDKTFMYSQTKKLHMSEAHETIKDYKCELCEKTFSRPFILQQHKRLIH